jgi:hypothetical protein
MSDFLHTLALRGAGLAPADGPALLAPRVPARFEPVAGAVPFDEAGLDPDPAGEAAWREPDFRAPSAPQTQESGLMPPTARSSQIPSREENQLISRLEAADVVPAQLDAPRRPVPSGEGDNASRSRPVHTATDATVSRIEPARRLVPSVPGGSPTATEPVTPARGDRPITTAPAAQPEIVGERATVEAHAATPRAAVLPSVSRGNEPAGRGDALPATSRQAPSPARPREVVAPVNVTIGRIEIQVAAPAAPATPPAPILRTRGFDAYSHARRGHRR